MIRALSLAMRRPRSAPAWGARPHDVLYLRPDRVGDMISTGLLRAIATSHSTIRLHVLATPSNAAVLEHNPHVASVVLLHHPKRPWRWLSFVRAARRARYDAVIDCKVLSPSLTLLLLMLASGARERIGVGGRANPLVRHPLPGRDRRHDGADVDAGGEAPLGETALADALRAAVRPARRAIEGKTLGFGQVYLESQKDKDGNWLDGGKSYHLRVPPNAPVKQFWSFTLYDNQTRGPVISPGGAADISSRKPDLVKNADGSVDLYFGPTKPASANANYVQTLPGRGWFTYFRLYGPTEPYFQKAWALPDIEPIQ